MDLAWILELNPSQVALATAFGVVVVISAIRLSKMNTLQNRKSGADAALRALLREVRINAKHVEAASAIEEKAKRYRFLDNISCSILSNPIVLEYWDAEVLAAVTRYLIALETVNSIVEFDGLPTVTWRTSLKELEASALDLLQEEHRRGAIS